MLDLFKRSAGLVRMIDAGVVFENAKRLIPCALRTRRSSPPTIAAHTAIPVQLQLSCLTGPIWVRLSSSPLYRRSPGSILDAIPRDATRAFSSASPEGAGAHVRKLPPEAAKQVEEVAHRLKSMSRIVSSAPAHTDALHSTYKKPLERADTHRLVSCFDISRLFFPLIDSFLFMSSALRDRSRTISRVSLLLLYIHSGEHLSLHWLLRLPSLKNLRGTNSSSRRISA
jgi:hypothetical protein